MPFTVTARTQLALSVWDSGTELEVEMVVKCTANSGLKATDFEPEEPASVEVDSIQLFSPRTRTEVTCPRWLSHELEQDEAFHRWLMAEAHEENERERDEAADNRREDERLGD